MLIPRFFFVVCVASCAIALPDLAFAQTVTMPRGVYPTRDQAFRPANLTPQGVNDADCANDTTLEFPLIVSGFDGSQNLDVWASLASDCTSPADRGVGGVSGQVCWRLGGGFVGTPYHSATTIELAVRVQDALAHLSGAVPFSSSLTHGDATSCSLQLGPTATQVQINFVPVAADGVTMVGTPFQYTLAVDLVGPPSPTGVASGGGHSFLDVTWKPNTDTDTIGYDVFMAPIPGQEGSTPADAGAGACASGVLAGGSAIPDAYRVGDSPTVGDRGGAQYQITGLQDGTSYDLVVSAVDGFGNVGSPSPEICNTPDPPADAGATGGGGGCALGTGGAQGTSLVCLACAITAIGVVRRRARRPSRACAA